MKKIIDFIKKEPVLTAAWVLALCSMLVIKPDRQYIGYIDMRTILLLFCLMTVMAGFRSLGVFGKIGAGLLNRVKSSRQLEAVLIFLPFFSSMVITNDVALITFVPLALEILAIADLKKELIFVVTMQTVAANLGSILLPVGNPQNLYLYSAGGYNLGEFVLLMLPYTVVSFFILCAVIFTRRGTRIPEIRKIDEEIKDKGRVILYCLLFAICLMTVAKLIGIYVMLAVVLAAVLVFDRGVLKKADYSLLFTFIGFFVFVGNISRIPAFKEAVVNALEGHEVLMSAAISQVISNVPAALLLSGFSEKINELLIGVNIGGLGTLIASMASLISYKYIAVSIPDIKGRYLAYFTAVNVLFLIVLAAVYILSVSI